MAIRGIPTAVLVAPDSFKGTFTAVEVADAVARGLASAGREVWTLPVADGGEGTLAALADPLGLGFVEIAAADPLGRRVIAGFGLGAGRAAGRGTGRGVGGVAVVEVAAASGLGRVGLAERDAVAASSYGTGELIAAAAGAGARTVLVAAGGSATTDGGAGAIEAITERGGLGGAKLVVLADVRTSFVDAARVFGPQKGADPGQVELLVARLERFADLLAQRHGRDPRGVPMGGAAGGLSGGLWAAFDAQLVAGAPYVLEAVGFDAKMRAARAVVTGEGRLDRQTLAGKAAGEIATRARQAGVPCHAVVGQNRLDRFDQRILDLQLVLEARTVAGLEDAGEKLAERL